VRCGIAAGLSAGGRVDSRLGYDDPRASA